MENEGVMNTLGKSLPHQDSLRRLERRGYPRRRGCQKSCRVRDRGNALSPRFVRHRADHVDTREYTARVTTTSCYGEYTHHGRCQRGMIPPRRRDGAGL